MEVEFLITGAASGVGKYLYERFGGMPLTRGNAENYFNSDYKVQTIIHCAFRQVHDAGIPELKRIAEENLSLTRRLLEIPHKKFVYFSSVDIYPSDGGPYDENSESRRDGAYAQMKIDAENLIRASSKRFLILRPASMLGPYSRKNSLLRMFEENEPRLKLTESSLINVVLYKQVGEFLSRTLEMDLTGIFNISSNESTTLGEVAKKFGKKTDWGTTQYFVSNTDNSQAKKILPELKLSTTQLIETYFQGTTGRISNV